MDNLTMGQTIAVIIGALLSLSAILGAVNQLVDTVNRVRKPGKTQDERLKKHDEEIQIIKRKLENDKAKIETQEKSNRLIMKSIMALLSHGINGNNVEQMKDALESLQEHLINN